MKRPFPLLSVMVLVLQRTYSSLMTIPLTMCSLLLDRCTSFCLQEHNPALLMSPAPLPVPLRLCLGRPCLLMLLLIHRGRELCSSGLAGPTTTIAHATTTSQLDELLQGFSDLQDPHPGSHLSDRIGPSRTTTRVDPNR